MDLFLSIKYVCAVNYGFIMYKVGLRITEFHSLRLKEREVVKKQDRERKVLNSIITCIVSECLQNNPRCIRMCKSVIFADGVTMSIRASFAECQKV